MDNVFYHKIVQLLDEKNIDYKERLNSITLQCPCCLKYKLDINKEFGYYICYYCAEKENIKGKNPAYVLSKILNEPYQLIKMKLSGLNLEAFDEDFSNKKNHKQEVFDVCNEIVMPEYFFKINLDISKFGMKYLNDRGIDSLTAKKHEIKYNTRDMQIIFPIYHNNMLVGYQGRSILKDIPKQYSKITMPGFKKTNYVMFEKTLNSDKVILAEGPISALKFEKTNIPFVASMGKHVSDQQFKLLQSKGVKSIYLALDRDAYSEAFEIVKKYQSIFDFYQINVPEDRDDFGDCSFEECQLAFNKAYSVNSNNFFPSF